MVTAYSISRRTLSFFLFLCVFAGRSVAQQTAQPTGTDRQIARAQSRVHMSLRDPAGYVLLGEAYLQKGRETNDASYYDLAKAAFERSLDLYAGDPVSAVPATHMAVAMMAEHRFHDALEWSNRALAFGLGDPAPWAIVGDAWADLGEYDKAAEAYARLVPAEKGEGARDSRRPLIYERDARLSYLHFINGDTRSAISSMENAVRHAVTDHLPAENIAWSYYQLGEEFFQAGDLPNAERAQQKALAIDPHSYRALAGLAKVRAAQGRLQEAADLYESSLRVVPVAEYAASLGDVYTQLGNAKDARKNYALVEFIGFLSALNQSLNNRELALYYADHDLKLPESLEFAKKELEVRQDVYSWDILAWACYKNGKPEQAAEAMSHALARGTRDALFYFHAGMISQDSGKLDEAKRYLKLALETNPHFHIVYAGMASERLALLEHSSDASGVEDNADAQ
jgi:tetratricopeptide (TPR) repeat protein